VDYRLIPTKPEGLCIANVQSLVFLARIYPVTTAKSSCRNILAAVMSWCPLLVIR
jgi:hypothetical protein